MVNTVVAKVLDIYAYPTELEPKAARLTIGDLHGNTAKLAHFLFRHGIIKFRVGIEPVSAYAEFIRIYEENAALCEHYCVLTQQSVKQGLEANILAFHVFLDQLQIVDTTTILQLIGDEVGDRGSNDYFTLLLLDLLKQKAVPHTKLVSNHGNEFVMAYESMLSGKEFKRAEIILDFQATSIVNLKLLLDLGIVTPAQLTPLVDSYKSTLKVIDYVLDDNGITLFTHAPVGFDMIKKIAGQLGVVYNDATKESLAATIEKINAKFAVAVRENKVHELLKSPYFPVYQITWDRWSDQKEASLQARPASVRGYAVNYVHGHDPFVSPRSHVFNLDTINGKASRALTGVLQGSDTFEKIHVSDGHKLDKEYDPQLIDKEYRQAQSNTRYTRVITGLSLALGLVLGGLIGAALISTGVFAIVGAVVIGAVIGAGLGFGLAKLATTTPPMDTTVGGAERDAEAMCQRVAVCLGVTLIPKKPTISAVVEVAHHASPLVRDRQQPSSASTPGPEAVIERTSTPP